MKFRSVQPGLQVRPALMLHTAGPPVKADCYPGAGARTYDWKVTLWLKIGFEYCKAKDYIPISLLIYVYKHQMNSPIKGSKLSLDCI